MARPTNKIISEKEQQQLLQNMEALEEAFTGQLIEGKKLHLIKRYYDEQGNQNGGFKNLLASQHPVLADALEVLPSGKTLTKHFTEGTPYKTVDRLALFCTKVFAFSSEVTADDLLTKNMKSFPPMRKISGLWGRYRGTYRCFYLEPNEDEEQLSAALLQLKEVKGDLVCRMIMGIKTEYCLEGAEKLFEIKNSKNLANRLLLLNDEDKNDSKQMYYYEGSIDSRTVPEYYLIQLRRYESHHAMTVFLRSWSRSQKPQYSGGLATVVRCRKEEILNYPMIVAREHFSLLHDKDLILKYLTAAMQKNYIKESKDMDEALDREARKPHKA